MSETVSRPTRDNRPEALVDLPSDNAKLIREVTKIIETCRNTQGNRAAYYRQLNGIMETGRQDQQRSLINLLYTIVDRLSSLMFSPEQLSFTIDFENEYEIGILQRAQFAARSLTRSWERNNTDVIFGTGVFEALKFGSSILKQWVQQDGPDRLPVYKSSLVMPWQFGVYREDTNDLDSQPALCETVMLTLPEVWRRISHMPDNKEMFTRIKSHSKAGGVGDDYNSFFHQVLSTSQLQFGAGAASQPTPGGVVQLGSDPNYSIVAPTVAADMVRMHEVWVWDRFDRTTIQIIEPDILIAPRYKRANLLISGEQNTGLHPYTLIQPNRTHGYIWGRSELVDLIEPHNFLSTTAQDIKRLFGVQVDKILGFQGFDGDMAETYDQQRAAGYVSVPPGATINDLTPKFPPEAIPLLDKLIQIIEMISGLDNILSGRGESGVRSGLQTSTLLKTAGQRLKDRSLLVERQCAAAGDLRLSMMQYKDGRNYWTNPKDIEGSTFLLSDLPDDRRVVVDSHSTSPIFAEDHEKLTVGGLKLGLLDPESAIEMMPFQNKDILLTRLRAKQEKDAALLDKLSKQDPEGFAAAMEKALAGKKK
jgi:hypothetical protein